MTQHLELALHIDVPSPDGGPEGSLDLDVRTYSVREEMSRPYEVDVTAVSPSATLDLEELVGATAQFRLAVRRDADSLDLGAATPTAGRSWLGHLAEVRQISAEVGGRSRYRVKLVPSLWLLTQKIDTRIFQHLSELEVALRVLSLWGIEPEVRVDREAHLRREYRTQYEETDFDFVNRMLEEAGVSYFFESKDDGGGRMVLTDAAQRNRPRPRPLVYAEAPDVRRGQDWATDLQLVRRVAPGRVTLTDHDFRKPPDVPIRAEAREGRPLEQALDVYEYRDGHFLYIAGDAGDPEDPADTEAVFRTDERRASTLAVQRLRAQRGRARQVCFTSNAFDLDTGDVVRMMDGPNPSFGTDGLLVVDLQLEGSWNTEWRLDVVAVSAAEEYRPPLRTPRPVVGGVESATVVGPAGEEIHVDRHGRVKVHFHWDRDGQIDEYSSCWMHASQPWGGAGYGGTMLPRIGQEVLVGFFESDPDRPIIVGRYYTSLQQTPYRLPANKTQSGIKTNSTGGSGGYNELMFEDRGGRELLHLRAQRDKTVRVNRNSGTTVGVDQSLAVGQHRDIEVGGDENRQVWGNRSVSVEGDQGTRVQGNVLRSSARTIVDHAGVDHHVQAVSGIQLHAGVLQKFLVGPSSIVISNECIMIRSPLVLINPSNADANDILRDGRPRESHRAENLLRHWNNVLNIQQQHVDAMPQGPARAAAQATIDTARRRVETQAATQRIFRTRPLNPPPPPPPPPQDEIVVTGRRRPAPPPSQGGA